MSQNKEYVYTINVDSGIKQGDPYWSKQCAHVLICSNFSHTGFIRVITVIHLTHSGLK